MRFTFFGALVVAILAITSASVISCSEYPAILPYITAISAGCILVSVLLWQVRFVSKRIVFCGALLLHFIALAGIPVFEDDYYRFIWDGWQILEHGTPYGTPPEAFFGDAKIPDAMRIILDGVNNPAVPTIYGPALEMFFALVYALAGTNLFGLRVAFAITNLVLIAMMLRQYPAQRAALYAWNPLVVSEIALHVHPDGVMALVLFAAVMFLKTRPVLAGVFFALAAGTKLVALAAWPLLLRSKPADLLTAVALLIGLYTIFLAQGAGAGFESTATFASQWHFNPLAYEALLWFLPPDPARLVAAAIAGLGVLWLHARAEGRFDITLTAIFGLILLFASAVNPWYLLWVLPFACSGRQIWPFAATVALPFSYLTGLNLGDDSLGPFEVHWAARVAEVMIIAAAVSCDIHRSRRNKAQVIAVVPIPDPRTAIIIPALNEEQSVSGVVMGLSNAGIAGLHSIIVVDNGSTDDTAAIARAAGAQVVSEPERGYGAACLAGIAALTDDIDIILFADVDASDVPQDAVRLVAEVAKGNAEMAIGSRMLGNIEPGAMTWPQRFGNWLAPSLIRMIWGVRFTDLGPLRAIRRDALQRLNMEDRNFGWTIEMQVRAAKLGLISIELPAGYRKRIGVSKISGTVSGVIGAGTKILFIIVREAFGDFGKGNQYDIGGEQVKNRSTNTCAV